MILTKVVLWAERQILKIQLKNGLKQNVFVRYKTLLWCNVPQGSINNLF